MYPIEEEVQHMKLITSVNNLKVRKNYILVTPGHPPKVNRVKYAGVAPRSLTPGIRYKFTALEGNKEYPVIVRAEEIANHKYPLGEFLIKNGKKINYFTHIFEVPSADGGKRRARRQTRKAKRKSQTRRRR